MVDYAVQIDFSADMPYEGGCSTIDGRWQSVISIDSDDMLEALTQAKDRLRLDLSGSDNITYTALEIGEPE